VTCMTSAKNGEDISSNRIIQSRGYNLSLSLYILYIRS
jgi:hypothetical protein